MLHKSQRRGGRWLYWATLGVVMVALLASPSAASGDKVRVEGATFTTSVTVQATWDPWLVDLDEPLGDGTIPEALALSAAAKAVKFPSVSGTWSFGGDLHSAEGCVYWETWDCEQREIIELTSTNDLSGLIDGDRFYYLVGVFTADRDARHRQARTLDFTGNHDFRKLRPKLGQVFYIGDGRTSDGTLQTFRPPQGATHLWLGMPDLCGWPAPPGCYLDNSGSLDVNVSVR